MSRFQEYSNEFRENGFVGVIKRLFYVLPNRHEIKRVKRAKPQYGLNTDKSRDTKVIVSLTSYPERFDNIYLCLKSLLIQDYKPDRIIVWFGSDTQKTDLTSEMLSLTEYGIEYRFDEKLNLRPHKKYIYAMQEFPDDIVITVDDDSVYPKSTILSLVNSYREHPEAVSARRVHFITYDYKGKLLPYHKWKFEYRKLKTESNDLLAVGVGGILYPPHTFDREAFNIERIQSLCLGADDIWLKCMELKRGKKVIWVPCFFAHPPALTSKSSLGQSNVGFGKNDDYLAAMVDAYGIRMNKEITDL